MTESKAKKRISADKLVLALAFFFLTGLFIKNSTLAAEYVRAALQLCAKTVIPSVFPCTVLSGIFIALGGGELIRSLFGGAMRRAFGISGAGATVILLGFFCGFPVGAAAGGALFRRGEISKDELCRLMSFANIPSPAFVISAVGEAMLGSRAVGIMLYLILLFVSVLIGVLQRLLSKNNTINQKSNERNSGFAIGVASAISSAASSMLNLCASVVFFSVLSKTALLALRSFELSPLVPAIIGSVFELSGGCAAAAGLGGLTAIGACAFALGWSGFCVHFQIISAVGVKMHLGVYFAAKFAAGVLSCALALLFSSLFSLF